MVGEDSSFDLPVREARAEWERNIFIHGLKSLEDKWVAHRGRFDVVRECYINDIDEERRGEEGDSIIVIIRMWEEVRVTRKNIWAGHKLSWDMDHFQVEVSEVDEPLGLLTIEGLGRAKVGEVFVISEDLYGEWEPVEVVSPGFQGTNDSKEFSVVDVIVPFCRREILEEIGTRVPVTIGVCLEEDGSRGVFGGIGCNGEGGGKVGEVKDWF